MRTRLTALGLLTLLALVTLGVDGMNEVGPTRMKVLTVAAGGDSTFTIDSIGRNASGDPIMSRVTRIGIRNAAGGSGTDSLGLHLMSGWTVMPYPQNVSDVFEIRLQLMLEIDRAGSHTDEVLRYDNNGGALARIIIWGS